MPKKITYRSTWAQTMGDLRECMQRWGVADWRIESEAALSARYTVRSLSTAEKRVTLGYRDPKSGRSVVLTVDAQETAAANLRVLYLAVDALRLNEVRGLEDTIRSAYLQLEAPERERDPYEVLGVRPDAPLAVAEASYRALAKGAHPDAGGSDEEQAVLNAAIERVRAEAARR